MIPTILTTTSIFIIAFIAATPVDINDIGEPVSRYLLYGNDIISGAIIPNSDKMHFYPIWEATFVDEWLYSGGPYDLIFLHFLLGVACYMGQWELSFRRGMQTWIVVAYSGLIAATIVVFLICSIDQGSFSDSTSLEISGTLNFMIVFQVEHTILMHPFHFLGVAGVFDGSLFSVMHGSLVTSSLIREIIENEYANEGVIIPTSTAIGLHFYPIWEATFVDEWLYCGGPYELIFLHFVLGVACYMGQWELSIRRGMQTWIVVAYSGLIVATIVVFLIYSIGQRSFSDSQGHVINTWFEIIKHANLGIEVMHERNAHNFPLYLDVIEAQSTNG
ncbi:unnamed protein product [Lactuca virosa]|uniref:Photosystem II protein D1 n=1 Tax=Lactuca virosa TaxID=75947 RepID=A0AAU9NRD4_9ASTR|nr:unnamed protein product [Lactuca virosa]